MLSPDALQARIATLHSDPEWFDMQETMVRMSPVYFAQETLTGPPEAPYNGRFLAAPDNTPWHASH